MVFRSSALVLALACIACDGGSSVDPLVPTSIVATTSTSLTAAASTVVSPAPSVLVTDQNAEPIAGVTVEFVVTGGGGSVTGGSVQTDASGIATVGSWSLGPSAGANTLSATTASLAPVLFTATGTVVTAPPPPPPPPPSTSPCDVRTVHAIGSTTTGSLASSDCELVDGNFVTYVDFFSTTAGEARAYQFRQSASFDTYLFLATTDLAVIAENDDESPTSTNSAIKALLPAGSYLLGASSFDARVTGDYSITSTTASNAITGCERVFVVKGVTTTQSIETSDCLRSPPPAAPIYTDAYLIFLRAGQSVNVTMNSIQVDAFLELVQIDDLALLNGSTVATNDNRDGSTKDSELSFTATTTAYYRILARTGVTSQTGTYTLLIQ